MKYEYCCKCGDKTGKAGAGDDSLYTEHGGPFCEDCFPDAQHKQEQGEPVYLIWSEGSRKGGWVNVDKHKYDQENEDYRWLLYTSPHLKRKPLSIEQIDALEMDSNNLPNSQIEFARAIEAAHGIKE